MSSGFFAGHLDEAYKRIAEDMLAAEPLAPRTTPEAVTRTGDDFNFTVRKLTAYVPVSCCALTDATGENHCQHPAPPRAPLRRRLRWRVTDRWSQLRYRVGSWVAGVDLDGDRDD
jgi:hypothetical protein